MKRVSVIFLTAWIFILPGVSQDENAVTADQPAKSDTLPESASAPKFQPHQSTVYELPDRLMLVQEGNFKKLPSSSPSAISESLELNLAADVIAAPNFVFLSATVYDLQKTLLRWNPPGMPDVEYVAWSNIDFNHFSGGTSEFVVNGNTYSLNMGLGNTTAETEKLTRKITQQAPADPPPPVPELATAGPAFVLVEGNASDTAALKPLSDFHTLYRSEGVRLKSEYEARETARLEAEASRCVLGGCRYSWIRV